MVTLWGDAEGRRLAIDDGVDQGTILINFVSDKFDMFTLQSRACALRDLLAVDLRGLLTAVSN